MICWKNIISRLCNLNSTFDIKVNNNYQVSEKKRRKLLLRSFECSTTFYQPRSPIMRKSLEKSDKSNPVNLYTQGDGVDQIYLLIYADDLLICSKSKKKIKNLKRVLSEKFKMKYLGDVKEYLRINVEYDYRNCDMKLSQTKYIESLTNKYQLQDSRLYTKLQRMQNMKPYLRQLVR